MSYLAKAWSVLKTGSEGPPTLNFIFRIVLVSLSPSKFCEFQDQLVDFHKEVDWNPDRDWIEAVDQFGKCCHPNNIVSDTRTRMSFHFFRLSSISFTSVLQFQEYQFYTYFVKFIPVFYSSYATVNYFNCIFRLFSNTYVLFSLLFLRLQL